MLAPTIKGDGLTRPIFLVTLLFQSLELLRIIDLEPLSRQRGAGQSAWPIY